MEQVRNKLIFKNHYSLLLLLGKLCSKSITVLKILGLSHAPAAHHLLRPGCAFPVPTAQEAFPNTTLDPYQPLPRAPSYFPCFAQARRFSLPGLNRRHLSLPCRWGELLGVGSSPTQPPGAQGRGRHRRQDTETSRSTTDNKESEETGFSDNSWKCISLRKSEWEIFPREV